MGPLNVHLPPSLARHVPAFAREPASPSTRRHVYPPLFLACGIVRQTLQLDPHLTLPFLHSLGSVLGEATTRVLYRRLTVALPELYEGGERGGGETQAEWNDRRRWTSVLRNPARYASAVKHITVVPPACPHFAPNLATTPVSHGEDDVFLALLEVCAGTVDRVEWRGVGVWGEAVSQQLLRLPALHHLSLLPPPLHPSSLATQYPATAIPRFHLPHPIPQFLRTLEISRLSPMGAKNFSSHITNLPGHSPLDQVSVDSALFDDALAESLAEAGRGVREVWIRSTGTKLTDKGLLALFEGCEELERLTLSEVQGRFSKSVWEKVEWPDTFKHLRIEISDVGPHHSWSLDHLLSIPAVRMAHLHTLSVTRTTPPFSLFPVPPFGLEAPPPDEVCAVRPIPDALLDTLLADGSQLRMLEIDWWEVDEKQVAKLAKALVNLEKFKFHLDAPFTKLLSMTTPFSSLVQLRTLHVIIPVHHHPLPSARQANPTVAPQTPSSSPTMTKSVLQTFSAVPSTTTANPSPPTSLSDLHHAPEELHPALLAKATDLTIPPLRDVRKFVRRLPRLTELGWVGRGGIGLWLATPPSSSSSAAADATLSPTIGRGRRASAGGGGAVVSSAGLKGVTDIEFLSFASHWKDEWAEAAKGFPAWNFEGGAGGGGDSPYRERSEWSGGLAAAAVGGSPRMSYSGGMDRSTSGDRDDGATKERRKSLGVLSSMDPPAGTSMVGLDLGQIDQGRQGQHIQRTSSIDLSPSDSLDDKSSASLSRSSSTSTSTTRSQTAARTGPSSAQSGGNPRRIVSSGNSSTLPTLASAGSADFEDYLTGPKSTSPTTSTATTPPALLSYRDRAALKAGSTSPDATLKTTTTSRGKKIVLGGGGGAPAGPSSPPVVATAAGGAGGGSKHARRASEPVAMGFGGGGDGNGGGAKGGGGGGKKVVNSNGWKTHGGAGGGGAGGVSGGGKKAGNGGGGKKK